MDSLTVYPDGTDKPGITFKTANAFVSRVVGAIANSDQMGCLVDAQRVADLLNAAAKADAMRRELLGGV